jgi:LytS/YehU family sensor histidine kinase
MLPFLENAFKHGTSDQLEKPWLNMDLTVKQNTMKCKIANSKNEHVTVNENGIGVQNVKKRLEFLYPEKHELKLNNGENFFVVSLLVELTEDSNIHPTASLTSLPVTETVSL